MSMTPGITRYLVRDSVLRWRGRASLPLSRLVIAWCLATTAILVLASFALATAELQQRITAFGLNTLAIRSPLEHATDPAPAFPELGRYGQSLTLHLTHTRLRLDSGGHATLALDSDRTLRELAALGVHTDAFPILLTNDLPAGMPVRAGIGPWWTEAITTPLPAGLRSVVPGSVLIASPAAFPVQARTPGQAATVLVRSQEAPSLDRLVTALQIMIAANPTEGRERPEVQSPLPLLREMERWQATSTRYTALLALVLAGAITLVFAAGAILEYESTEFTTALLRSLGVRRRILWLQRTLEALVLANLGGVAAGWTAGVIARAALPQLAAYTGFGAGAVPAWVALNLGAILATVPVATALRRPVGLILP